MATFSFFLMVIGLVVSAAGWMWYYHQGVLKKHNIPVDDKYVKWTIRIGVGLLMGSLLIAQFMLWIASN